MLLINCRYFGAAKDLPGVRELFEQESNSLNNFYVNLHAFGAILTIILIYLLITWRARKAETYKRRIVSSCWCWLLRLPWWRWRCYTTIRAWSGSCTSVLSLSSFMHVEIYLIVNQNLPYSYRRCCKGMEYHEGKGWNPRRKGRAKYLCRYGYWCMSWCYLITVNADINVKT